MTKYKFTNPKAEAADPTTPVDLWLDVGPDGVARLMARHDGTKQCVATITPGEGIMLYRLYAPAIHAALGTTEGERATITD